MTEGRIEYTGEGIFIIYDGKTIAKRGHPGTPYAETWISLEPGYTVRDADGGKSIEVEYQGRLTRIR
jgi:hypothetical protein